MAKAPNTDPFASAPGTTGAKDPFSAPAPQSDRPRIRDMFNHASPRLLLISPEKVEEVVRKGENGKPDRTEDRMTATLVVLDGGPLDFGGAPEKTIPVPHTVRVETPYEVESLFISGVGLVKQCRNALRARELKNGEPTMVLGRLSTGEAKGGNNPPWILLDPTPEDMEIARQYLNSKNPFAS